jgi:hypothetical protein
MFENGVLIHQKADGRSPPRLEYNDCPFLRHRRTKSALV